jgi:multiple sugar transport system substrate-binding protein
MTGKLSRRSFLGMTGFAGLGIVAAGTVAACSSGPRPGTHGTCC